MVIGSTYCSSARYKQYIKLSLYICIILLFSLILTAFGWHSGNIPAPTKNVGIVETEIIDWLSSEYKINKPHDNLFLRLALYAEPDECNKLMKAYKRPLVSTNNVSPKWYMELVHIKAQGVSHFCSMDKNGKIILEWQCY